MVGGLWVFTVVGEAYVALTHLSCARRPRRSRPGHGRNPHQPGAGADVAGPGPAPPRPLDGAAAAPTAGCYRQRPEQQPMGHRPTARAGRDRRLRWSYSTPTIPARRLQHKDLRLGRRPRSMRARRLNRTASAASGAATDQAVGHLPCRRGRKGMCWSRRTSARVVVPDRRRPGLGGPRLAVALGGILLANDGNTDPYGTDAPNTATCSAACAHPW